MRALIRRLFFVCCLFAAWGEAHAQRQMEALGRGVVAISQGSGRVYVSWRLLGTDADEIAFNLYRQSGSGMPEKLNAAPLTQTTDFLDTAADLARPLAYFVRPIMSGVELPASTAALLPANAPVRQYLSVPLQPPAAGTTPDGQSYTYVPNDASAADLDGDGEYEIVLKWDPTNAQDNAFPGYTGNVFLDAYKLNGARLWRIDLGRNIRAGAHYTQFMVYDLDGDGRAEVACKTADGTIDGLGVVIGSATADWREGPGTNVPTGDSTGSTTLPDGTRVQATLGRMLSGPEFLTIFDGLTGRALATTNYVPARGRSQDWGDAYANRSDRFLAGVAYLDGRNPSLLMCRGYYTRTVIVAWDWRGGRLTQRWKFDTRTDENPGTVAPGFVGWEEMGNHQLSIADVDDDGRDEIIYGSMVVDDDGRGLYTTGRGHGDALHVSDMDPDRPGLEIYGPHETPRLYGEYGSEMRDARTGAVIWGASGGGSDVGRGVAMDIDPRYRGYEAWAARGGLYSAKGELITNSRPSQMNFAIWWDADPLREILDGTTISKWDWINSRTTTLFSATGAASNNGTKSTPALSADLFGDWREEVIFRASDNSELRIYTTTIPATSRMPTLMHDPQYRAAIAWQNVAYNQPPHPGFFLGDGMTRAPTPVIRTTPRPGRLANLSIRTEAGEASETVIVGFSVAGEGQQNLLVRGVGPTLGSSFGVGGAMSDPQLTIYRDSTMLGTNNDWSADAAADQFAAMATSVGAFPLPRPSRDAVLLRSLAPGSYTTQLSAASGSRGVALVEVYASAVAGVRLANLSARARAGTGTGTLIAGFVVDVPAMGSTRTFLIRAIGPALAQFGVTGVLADPRLAVYRGDVRLAGNDDWNRDSGVLPNAFTQFGAFALPHGSKDSALLLNLPPGAYSVHVNSVDGGSGVALVEIYEVDS